MEHRSKKSLRLFLPIILALHWTVLSFADSFSLYENSQKNKVTMDAFFSAIRVDGEEIRGLGLQIGFSMALHEKLAVGASFSEAFASTMSSLFTQISLEAKWALTGSVLSSTQRVSSEDQAVVQIEPRDNRGIMLHGFLQEYLIYTSQTTLGYTGLGAGVSYEMPFHEHWNFRAGVRTDYSIRSSSSLFAYQVFGGFSYRF